MLSLALRDFTGAPISWAISSYHLHTAPSLSGAHVDIREIPQEHYGSPVTDKSQEGLRTVDNRALVVSQTHSSFLSFNLQDSSSFTPWGAEYQATAGWTPSPRWFTWCVFDTRIWVMELPNTFKHFIYLKVLKDIYIARSQLIRHCMDYMWPCHICTPEIASFTFLNAHLHWSTYSTLCAEDWIPETGWFIMKLMVLEAWKFMSMVPALTQLPRRAS